MARPSIEQNIWDNSFNARNRDKSLQGATAWKRFKQRPCSRGDSCSFKHELSKKKGKEMYPVPLPMRREDTQKGHGKGNTKRTPKGTNPSTKSKNFGMLPFSEKSNAKRIAHVIIGTHKNAHTQNPTVDENAESVCMKHTSKRGDDKTGNATVAPKWKSQRN